MPEEEITLYKFASEAANENNLKWKNMISRERKLYEEDNLRSEFQRDYSRIIYSNAYKRLKHKTQVFFAPSNDHICTRIEHVNYVESISYLLAKSMGLNTELTKTISISHDLGHSPFGHNGERILNKILLADAGKEFWHEKNGLNYVDNIELLEDREGYKENLDLTYAVRDGIVSHCGEIDENVLRPREEFIDLNTYNKPNQYSPYTWEGCIVKIVDKISYLGRDIEDAYKLKLLDASDLNELNQLLGIDELNYKTMNNTNIIDFLCKDLLKNSSIKNGLTFSKNGLEILNNIKDFNYRKIYNHERLAICTRYFETIIYTMYDILKSVYSNKIEDIRSNPKIELYPELINEFLNWLIEYCITENHRQDSIVNLKNHKIYDINKKKDYCQAIVEYIAGMTDNKAIDTYNKIIGF